MHNTTNNKAKIKIQNYKPYRYCMLMDCQMKTTFMTDIALYIQPKVDCRSVVSEIWAFKIFQYGL